MIVSETKRFVFTRCVKTGSTSLSAALKPYSRSFEQSLVARGGRRLLGLRNQWPFVNFAGRPHLPLAFAARVIPENKFSSYFKFGVVRNPQDRMVSLFKHWKVHFQGEPASVKTLEDFVYYWSEFRPYLQVLQFVSTDGVFLADEVGRFELLQIFFDQLRARLNLQSSLPMTNPSATSVSVSVTDRARRLIEKKCMIDYEVFDFGNISSPTMRVSIDATMERRLACILDQYGGVSFDPWSSSLRGKKGIGEAY